LESTGEWQQLGLVEGGPERFFRVARPEARGEVVASSMPVGPWLNGPSGRPLAGALGVLIDNVGGYALQRGRPRGGWSVSAEITLDLLRPVPADGAVLVAEGSVRHADPVGGFASVSVIDGSGRLLAVCTQRGRWVPRAPAAGNGTAPASTAPASTAPASTAPASTAPARGVPSTSDLARFLGGLARAADGAGLLELTVTPELTNPLGSMHGGVALCACDLVTEAAIEAAGGPPRTASIHVAYLRPIPLGTRVRFTAQVTHLGRAFGVVRVTAVNADGKPCVIATVTTGPPVSP